jgi:hypothetical protein
MALMASKRHGLFILFYQSVIGAMKRKGRLGLLIALRGDMRMVYRF